MTRNYSLDILRILACLMIVAMHSPMPSGAENGLFLSSLSYLTAAGVGLFFMISGALLLPVKTDTSSFLKKRFSKIAVPTVIWSVVFVVLDSVCGGSALTWNSLLSIPFSAQGNPTFWFLYTLMGLYLLAPILSKWLDSTSCKELELYLMIWGVSMCYPLLKLILDINTTEVGILYYFTGYAGYFVLGHYLVKYPGRMKLFWLIPLLVISYVVPALCKVKDVSVDFYSLFWYLSIFVAIQCVFIWKLVCIVIPAQGWTKANQVISRISSLTFGVYLFHFFIIRYLLWNWNPIASISSYVLQTAAITLSALGLSFILSVLISYLPFANYLIGTKRQRRA